MHRLIAVMRKAARETPVKRMRNTGKVLCGRRFGVAREASSVTVCLRRREHRATLVGRSFGARQHASLRRQSLMNIAITFRHMDATDSVKIYATEKVGK